MTSPPSPSQPLPKLPLHADVPEWCPGCRDWKPLVEWIGTEIEYDPQQAVVCASCREGREPPPADFLPALEPQERKIIEAVLRHGTYTGAAKELGLAESTVRAHIAGHRKPEVRVAFQRLLEQAGLDARALVRKASMLMNAQRAQWNKGAERWDYFPDNAAQLGTLRHLTKLHELEPPKELEGSAPVAIQINTNIFDETDHRERPGAFTVRAVSSEPAE